MIQNLSDANSFFIDTYLSSFVTPDALITNQAEKTEEGYLKLTPYECQTECPFCPRSLCKGAALTKYISKKGPFEKVYYTGDGGNDVCPALRLTDADIVFARKNYAMDKHGVWKGQTLEVKARIVYWENSYNKK